MEGLSLLEIAAKRGHVAAAWALMEMESTMDSTLSSQVATEYIQRICYAPRDELATAVRYVHMLRKVSVLPMVLVLRLLT